MSWTDVLKTEIRRSREKSDERQDKADALILAIEQILNDAVAISDGCLALMSVRPDTHEASRGWHVVWEGEGMPRSLTIAVYPQSGEIFIHKMHHEPVYLDVLEPGPRLVEAVTSTLVHLVRTESWERFTPVSDFLQADNSD
jgi:hypothetical protein